MIQTLFMMLLVTPYPCVNQERIKEILSVVLSVAIFSN